MNLIPPFVNSIGGYIFAQKKYYSCIINCLFRIILNLAFFSFF